MQILHLDTAATWILDIIAWVIFHLGISFFVSHIPIEHFSLNRRFYQTFRWERGGAIYQQLFRVRSWKRFIPNGSKVFGKDNFTLQHLTNLNPVYLETWLRESIRAEFCHWMLIFPGFFFFLWNNVAMSLVMMVYAILNNFFPIVAQRFNRPRVRRYLEIARQQAQRNAAAGNYFFSHSEVNYEYAGTSTS